MVKTRLSGRQCSLRCSHIFTTITTIPALSTLTQWEADGVHMVIGQYHVYLDTVKPKPGVRHSTTGTEYTLLLCRNKYFMTR